MAQLYFKRGDTFKFEASSELWADLLPSELRAQVRDAYSKELAEVEVSAGAAAGEFAFRTDDTAEWREGWVYMDIEWNAGGARVSTETIEIYVSKDVTI